MLAGLDVRPEAPRTMLLLHGGGVGPWQWKNQIEAFPEFRVLAPELPGHGDSAGVLPCTIRNCADQVALFLEEKAGPGPVTLIAHSLGAQVALQLLADRPERFDRAAIFSALAIPTPNLYRFGVAPFIGPTLWMLRANWVVRLTARQLRFTDPDSAMALRRSLRSLSRDVLEAIYRENQLFRLPERLSAVHCPRTGTNRCSAQCGISHTLCNR